MVQAVLLSKFDNSAFERGASRLREAAWLLISGLLVDSWIPGSKVRVWLLQMFGAKIGRGAVLKPHLRIKFPWRLQIGESCWLGEGVWIDNLADVTLADNVCVSQGAYICTGSHDWSSGSFSLVVSPVSVGSCAWICARVTVCPGSVIEEGAVIAAGATVSGIVESWAIYSCARGNSKMKRIVSNE